MVNKLTLVIIGCGGVASYLLPPLIRTFRGSDILLVDGDTLEERNLDRQLFEASAVGSNKAEALAQLYTGPLVQLKVLPEYFHSPEQLLKALGKSEQEMESVWLLSCVDNHTARRRILEAADRFQCRTILGGNEFTDAEAMVYAPVWEGTKADPRVYYPEILTDNNDDPLRPVGCQGETQQAHPQLALANNSAASHMLHLLWFYEMEYRKLGDDFRDYAPAKHNNNFSRIATSTVGDLKNEC